MRLLLVTVLIASLLCIASCDESVENESKDSKVEENSVKKKRSYHGFYGPYTRYTSIFKTPVSTYALTPGNAIVHSFNVNYPKVFLPKPVARPILPPPVLYHTKPTLSIPSVPIYANRYPVFVQSPVVYQKPFSTLPSPAFIPSAPAIPPSYPGFLPQSTSDGWRPIYSSAPYFPHTHINQPSNTVLPPLNPTHLPAPSQTQTPNNYYLPPSQSIQQQDPQTADLQHHLEHLQKFQEIQHHQNFLRDEQNDGFVTSLPDQGYETASNNGRYAGPSSYDVHLNSRGRVN